MKYSYRIESVHVPATGDKIHEFDGRRIVHVLTQLPPGASHGTGITLIVLTEGEESSPE